MPQIKIALGGKCHKSEEMRRGEKKGQFIPFAEETGSPRILRSAHGARNDAKTHLSQRPARRNCGRGCTFRGGTVALLYRCSAVIWHDLNDETKYKR